MKIIIKILIKPLMSMLQLNMVETPLHLILKIKKVIIKN